MNRNEDQNFANLPAHKFWQLWEEYSVRAKTDLKAKLFQSELSEHAYQALINTPRPTLLPPSRTIASLSLKMTLVLSGMEFDQEKAPAVVRALVDQAVQMMPKNQHHLDTMQSWWDILQRQKNGSLPHYEASCAILDKALSVLPKDPQAMRLCEAVKAGSHEWVSSWLDEQGPCLPSSLVVCLSIQAILSRQPKLLGKLLDIPPSPWTNQDIKQIQSFCDIRGVMLPKTRPFCLDDCLLLAAIKSVEGYIKYTSQQTQNIAKLLQPINAKSIDNFFHNIFSFISKRQPETALLLAPLVEGVFANLIDEDQKRVVQQNHKFLSGYPAIQAAISKRHIQSSIKGSQASLSGRSKM